MLKNLLLYRLLIIDLIAIVLVGYAASQGWVQKVVLADHTGIVWIVILFFGAFNWSLWWRASKVSAALNRLKDGETVEINSTKFMEKSAHLDEMPGWILLIGVIGNVLGIMLSIQAAGLDSGDPQEAIRALLSSMDVAFGATIVSGVLGIWADIQRRVLRTATVLMLQDAVQSQVAEIDRQMNYQVVAS